MKHRIFRYGLFVLLLAGITLAILYRDQLDAAALEQWVQNAGTAGPVLFMFIYALGTLLSFPGSVLTLAGGALFGPVLGTVYNLTGATLGATLAFLAARYLASDWVERRAGRRIRQLQAGVEAEGWRFIAFVRLVPLFPFNLLNYALGLTRIRLTHYIIASYLFMLPGAIAYTYLGYATREAVAGDAGLGRMIQLGSVALAFLAVIAFLPRIIARFRQGATHTIAELTERLRGITPPLVLDVRGAGDFTGEMGHIQGARNIPLEELESRINELNDYRKRPLALICRTDRRSAAAAQFLTRQGFADVHIVRGGMVGWNEAKLPVVHGQ